METRYVYWRKPTGAAYKGLDNKHALDGLLADIGRTASINAEGLISWSGMWFKRFEQAVLGSVIVIDPEKREVNQHDGRSIVRSAMRALITRSGGKSVIDPAALLRESDKQAATYFRKQQQHFHLVTSLSVKSFPAQEILVDKCRVLPLRTRARYPVPDTLRHDLEREGSQNRPRRNRHQLVRVRTVGRSRFDATDCALEALALLCGLWNLFGTYGSWSIDFGSRKRKRKPLAVVHVGPFHTLHTQDGKPVDDLYWYEPDYAEHREPFNPSRGWDGIEKHRRWAMGRLRQSPYRPDLRRLIHRYSAALSKSDPDVAFLQMWSILELITNTVGARYEETVRRATWIFKDGDLARELLTYLRCYRNQFVHAAHSDDDRDQIAQLIKSFIDPHLLGLLRNDFRVQSLEEYAACLSLPTSVDKLKRHRQRAARALSLRNSWGKAQ